MRLFKIAVMVVSFIFISLYFLITGREDTIKIGLLYSNSGVMATEERAIAEVVRYSIDRINKRGGLLSKKIEIVEYDGKSNSKEFKKGAEYLISKNIKTIFGCWTSASRKAVKPILEKNEALLFYPVQYEGFEESNNIIYLGSTANQQMNSIIGYIKKNFGNRVYFVGSDYIYPQMTYSYLKELSSIIDLNILGVDFTYLSSKDFKSIVDNIEIVKPDAIINALNGQSNISFFKELNMRGIDSTNIPVFSTSIDESTINSANSSIFDGHYFVQSYFNIMDNIKNIELKNRINKVLGSEFILTESSYNIYLAVELWKKAVIRSNSFKETIIIDSIKGDSLNTVFGVVFIDRNNNHIHKSMSIAKINHSTTDIVWSSNLLYKPIPFPLFKPKQYWIDYEKKLYNLWGNSWENSPTKGLNNE